MKSESKARTTRAIIIGFMVGVVIYSAVNNTIGLLTLIPLFIAYQMAKPPVDSTDQGQREQH